MPQKVRIALDAMGGDHGAPVAIAGAAVSHGRHPDTEFILVGDRTVVAPLARGASRARGGLTDRPHRRRRQNEREAQPGAAPWPVEILDVDGDRRRQERRRRCRRLGRQHRRADGDGAVSPQADGGDHPPGDRGAVADIARGIDRPRRRRHHRRRCPAPRRARHHGRRHGAGAVRSRAADGGPPQHRRRGGQGPRAGARGRPHPARGGARRPRLCRLRRGRRHRQGDRGRRGHRGLFRQYRLENRRRNRQTAWRIFAQRHEPDAVRQARLSARAPCVRGTEGQDGSTQGQRRSVSRPQRHRHQEPWRHRCRGLRRGRRPRLRHGPLRAAGQDFPDARHHQKAAVPVAESVPT